MKNIHLAMSFPLCMLLGGCAGVSGTTSVGSITLSPGDSSTCFDSPCTVYFMMPPGEGMMVVKEDGPAGVWETGKFEAGKKVELGSYWAGRTEFTVQGANVPAAWLTVTGRR